ncbi:MAG TPA: DUF308 domain-containing protein [Puia sp.]|jgi:uncharacterized membrane protein HdeD (DUF308 family)|nr:DUF308 domain-containing protein [Puia sp.]
MNTLADTLVTGVKNWWWFVIKGLLLITAGVAILARPAEGYIGLSVLFSIVILGVGITQIFFSIGNSDVLKGWGWTFAAGIIDVAIGFYLITYPIITMATLPYFVGFWLMFRSLHLMGASFDLKTMGVAGWGWLLTGGLAVLILAFLILYFPAAGAISIIAYSATAFILAGILNLILAVKFKTIKKDVKSFEGKFKHATGY